MTEQLQKPRVIFWACPYCVIPMEYKTSFVDNSVHRYQCKFCKKKFDVQEVVTQ